MLAMVLGTQEVPCDWKSMAWTSSKVLNKMTGGGMVE